MNSIDMTGRPVSARDVAEAQVAIRSALVDPRNLTVLPPQLAVNLPNILRCLNELAALKGPA